MTSEGLIIGAGGLAFAGNFKHDNGFPENGYAIIGATVALVFLASTVQGSALDKPVKALAGLMLLASMFRYVPGFYNPKDKHHG